MFKSLGRTQTVKDEVYFMERIGVGCIKEGHYKGNVFFTEYKVSFVQAQISYDELASFCRDIISSKRPPGLIQIEILETPRVSSETTLTIKSQAFDKAIAEKMFENILSIGKEIEKRFLSKKILIRL